MNLKNCTYMASTEFKGRQLWLDFKDAIGAALEVLAEIKANAWNWFKKWKGAAMKCKFDNRTLELNFDVKQEPQEKQKAPNNLKKYVEMMEENETETYKNMTKK